MVEPKQASPKKRVALITGSGKRRLGWHIASALAERGYALALHYRTSAADATEGLAALRSRGVEASAFQADLADEFAARHLLQDIVAQFGRIDVLIHCASIWQQRPLEDVRADDVRRHFEANVLSTFLCAQNAGLAMVRQPEGGCIITFGDCAEIRPYRDYTAYFATKGAIPTLTRCLAVELATRNSRVRVNCVLPGPVLLPPDLPVGERQRAIATTLVRSEGGPASVVQAVLFLIDDSFVTGSCITVDGGRSLFVGGA